MDTPPPSSSIPPAHGGQPYEVVMSELSEKRSTARYLEIGVQTGELLQQIHAETAIGVDPEFAIQSNVAMHKRSVRLAQATSDRFFAEETPATLGGTIDLAFLDGMHTFEFLLRDFYNTERLCTSRSLIAMHDCLPLNAEMAQRSMAEAIQLGLDTPYPFHWTGDVWKIVPILKAYRPDLRVICVDAPPTGIVFVTDLDPTSDVLSRAYREIVDAFRAVPNDRAQIEAFYAGIELIPTSAILNEMDHSLYFRV